METLSLILSILSIIFSVLASFTKGQKNIVKILILMSLCNLSAAMSYVVLGEGINASASCFLGTAVCIVNYFFNAKKLPVPLFLSVIYAVAFTALNLAVFDISQTKTVIAGICAIIACLCFVMSVIQNSGSMFRIWTLFNTILWCTYDIIMQTWQPLLIHVTLLIFYIAGIIVNDRKTKKESE